VAAIGGSGFGNVLAVGGDYSTGSAQGVVKINTLLNDGGPLTNQVTDRMLIAGNASGSSSVVVRAYGLGAFPRADVPSATHGISLIQVAGNSSAGAFTLPGGYLTGGTPYRYQLYAFGPGSPNGAAAAGQSLIGNAGSQWDYRLENVFVSPEGPVSPTDKAEPESRPELTPQVPAYIALPTALFGAGFQDIDNLHRRLGEIRDDQLIGLAPAAELFVRGYGSKLNYTSNRSFTDFGFNSNQDYGAVQFGGNYIVHNGANGTLRAGLAAMFGQLWFQPHALDASSGKFDTDTLAGTLTWQSTAGWYVDAIVSGGTFNGNVAANGRPSTQMNGTSFAGSLEAGYPIALGWQQLTLEPQAQLVYQHLDFAQVTDADGIVTRLGSQDQGIFRGGARLTRQFATPEGAQITPYLKANLLQGIGGGGAVNIGDTPFLTGRFGSSVQVGGGATGMITRNLSVYGDAAWQDGVGGGGARGWTMNGGLRYAF
jgi:outer membrane autotransporter protein